MNTTTTGTFAVGDVVTIHTGTTQYDVTQVDTLDGGFAKVWPRDPQDQRYTHTNYAGQWVSFGQLNKVPAGKVINYPDPDGE